LAKAMGGRVLAAVASKDKEDIVRAAGADAVIDLSTPDLKESLRAQVYTNTLILLPLSRHSRHGGICCWPRPGRN
jgi:D-arabinose 1-dehydrogenase-like Zn-dependent alcohol dehydrogenase